MHIGFHFGHTIVSVGKGLYRVAESKGETQYWSTKCLPRAWLQKIGGGIWIPHRNIVRVYRWAMRGSRPAIRSGSIPPRPFPCCLHGTVNIALWYARITKLSISRRGRYLCHRAGPGGGCCCFHVHVDAGGVRWGICCWTSPGQFDSHSKLIVWHCDQHSPGGSLLRDVLLCLILILLLMFILCPLTLCTYPGHQRCSR